MAYVDIPKDLDGIKSKFMLGLTKRQLIGFGAAAVIGIPIFLATRIAAGNDVGLLLMIASMALPLLYGIYEPKGNNGRTACDRVASLPLRFYRPAPIQKREPLRYFNGNGGDKRLCKREKHRISANGKQKRTRGPPYCVSRTRR